MIAFRLRVLQRTGILDKEHKNHKAGRGGVKGQEGSGKSRARAWAQTAPPTLARYLNKSRCRHFSRPSATCAAAGASSGKFEGVPVPFEWKVGKYQ
jgi:hypothetical protein